MRSSLAEAIASVPSTTSVDVLCDLLREAGLLGVADVTFLKKTLSAPVTMGQVERLLLSQNEPARRAHAHSARVRAALARRATRGRPCPLVGWHLTRARAVVPRVLCVQSDVLVSGQ